MRSYKDIGIIAGTPVAFIGVTETTARGSLHFHVVIWGGLSPEILEKSANIPQLCSKVTKVLDRLYCSRLSRTLHVRDLLAKNMHHHLNVSGQKRKRDVPRSFLMPPDPTENINGFMNFSFTTACKCGMHSHCMTCFKGWSGKTGCRLAMPQDKKQKTGPVELVDTTPGTQLSLIQASAFSSHSGLPNSYH